MEGTERDSTQEWLLPEGSTPPLLRDLELRIDEALTISRASEAAVKVVGEAAIDAAKQARRAAEMAERASQTALEVRRDAPVAVAVAPQARPPVPVSAPPQARPPAPAASPPIAAVTTAIAAATPPEGTVLRSFSERADRVTARLHALERRPQRARVSSAAAGHRRPGG